MRGNPGTLAVVICALGSIVPVALGAQIYRWELITWQLIAATMAALGWFYSRRSPS
jgi:hypothetical protein